MKQAIRCGEQESQAVDLEDTEMSSENKHHQGAGLVSQKEHLLRMGLGMKFIADPEEGQAHGLAEWLVA